MGEFIHKEDHDAEAYARLIQILKSKSKLQMLLSILVAPAQELEDTFRDLRDMRTIDSSTGAQLDMIGRILHHPRDGALDVDYRPQLKARILVLDSTGSIPELGAIIERLATGREYSNLPKYPAALEATVLGVSAQLRAIIFKFLTDAKLGAVNLQAIMGSSPDADTFSLSSVVNTVQTSTTQGLSDSTMVTGGKLTSANGV